jgi:hypothetical protein
LKLDALEGLFYRNLHLAQGGNRPLDPHERRPPHNNYGQRPRDDESDNSDDDDDDFHHPPGARIRRPVTPNAGPVPLPDHLDIARPGRDTARPTHAGPEEARGQPRHPGPAEVPAAVDPALAEHIGAFVRALQGQNHFHFGDTPAPAPPTPETTFTSSDRNYVPTFGELKLAMESLKEQYDEYTTSKSFFSSTKFEADE